MSKELAKKAKNEIISSGYSTESTGFEDMDRSELSIPYLVLLQAMSPQVQPGVDRVDGAEAGFLMNTLTQEVTPGNVGVHVVPLLREHMFVEYAPREAGGGVVSRRLPSDPMVRKLRSEQGRFGKLKTPTGNELTETFYLYCGVLENPEDDFFSGLVLISFTSTKIKAYQNIMTRLRSSSIVLEDGSRVSPPLWANRLHITTMQQKNNHGTFFNFKIAPSEGTIANSLIAPDSPLIGEAESFIAQISEGRSESNETAPEDSDDAPY